jgi:hypothetical protein
LIQAPVAFGRYQGQQAFHWVIPLGQRCFQARPWYLSRVFFALRQRSRQTPFGGERRELISVGHSYPPDIVYIRTLKYGRPFLQQDQNESLVVGNCRYSNLLFIDLLFAAIRVA